MILGIAFRALALLSFRKKRELNVGKLIEHQEFFSHGFYSIVEQVKFRNSVECIKNYNDLVFVFSKNPVEKSGWTYHKFQIQNGNIELFRFGNCIKMIKKMER